jgi:hypothetical protein
MLIFYDHHQSGKRRRLKGMADGIGVLQRIKGRYNVWRVPGVFLPLISSSNINHSLLFISAYFKLNVHMEILSSLFHFRRKQSRVFFKIPLTSSWQVPSYSRTETERHSLFKQWTSVAVMSATRRADISGRPRFE